MQEQKNKRMMETQGEHKHIWGLTFQARITSAHLPCLVQTWPQINSVSLITTSLTLKTAHPPLTFKLYSTASFLPSHWYSGSHPPSYFFSSAALRQERNDSNDCSIKLEEMQTHE